jgi:hypothetical protein
MSNYKGEAKGTAEALSALMAEHNQAVEQANRMFLMAEARYFREQSVVSRRAYAHAKKVGERAVAARDALLVNNRTEAKAA